MLFPVHPHIFIHTHGPWFEYHFPRETFPGPLRPHRVYTALLLLHSLHQDCNEFVLISAMLERLRGVDISLKERRWFSSQTGFLVQRSSGLLEPSLLPIPGDCLLCARMLSVPRRSGGEMGLDSQEQGPGGGSGRRVAGTACPRRHRVWVRSRFGVTWGHTVSGPGDLGGMCLS